MNKSQKFHIGDILSVSTGYLVSPRGIIGLRDILSFMESKVLSRYDLPLACDECKPALIKAMPWLTEIDASSVNEENYEQWIAGVVKGYGEYYEVEVLPDSGQTDDPKSAQGDQDHGVIVVEI